MEEWKVRVVQVAAMSKCKKRKVGAIILDIHGNCLSEGFNYSSKPELACEDEAGKTLEHVVHAEISAIDQLKASQVDRAATIVVSHEPCSVCLAVIRSLGIQDIVVADSFMKFDTDKLRYDLIPTSSMQGLAEVLTYGAKKYKPNNWREVDDTDRYVGATMRHFEAWRSGETTDEESGLHHLKHALTNIAFLLELDND